MKPNPAVMILFLSLFANRPAFANVMNVALDCQSASGKTVVSADLPGDDEDASFALTYQGKKTSFVNDQAKTLSVAGNQNINKRISGGDIINVVMTITETETSYSINGTFEGSTLFSLTSTGPFRLSVDRDYGYRKGIFKAKLNSLNPQNGAKPLVADLTCRYDYAP